MQAGCRYSGASLRESFAAFAPPTGRSSPRGGPSAAQLMATSRRAAVPLDAYVLHRYDWSETSLILDLFTRSKGRVTVAAKGAKRPYSQLRSVLLPFQRLTATIGRQAEDAQADVVTLRSAEWAGLDATPVLPPARLFAGFYLNELLMKLLARGDAHPALFDGYAATLRSLATSDDFGEQIGLRAFELVLLKAIGLLPELDRVTATDRKSTRLNSSHVE